MIMISCVIIITIISFLCIIIGKLISNSLLLKIGYIILSLIVIFIISFYAYSMHKNNEEYKSRIVNVK